MKPKKLRLVLVEWHDTHTRSHGSWESHEDIVEHASKPLTCLSVGWLLHDGKHCKVVLPNSYSEDGAPRYAGCEEISIPTGCVVKITELVKKVRKR